MTDLKDEANRLWNVNYSPLDVLLKSNGSVGVYPKNCERCGKQFRLWRSGITVWDNEKILVICKKCVNNSDNY